MRRCMSVRRAARTLRWELPVMKPQPGVNAGPQPYAAEGAGQWVGPVAAWIPMQDHRAQQPAYVHDCEAATLPRAVDRRRRVCGCCPSWYEIVHVVRTIAWLFFGALVAALSLRGLLASLGEQPCTQPAAPHRPFPAPR